MHDKQRILIVSNNPFSETSNNGKTMLSFFSMYDNDQVAQLFFKNEIPSFRKFKNYYQLTDKDILFFRKGKRMVETAFPVRDSNGKATNGNVSDFFRVLREVIWKVGPWKNSRLDRWINEFQPNMIFFCAGDSIFAYRIVNYIQKKWGAKIVTYITDDYIMPRSKDSFIGSKRRKIIWNKMSEIVSKSSAYFVISKSMNERYEKIFGKQGIVLNNAQNFSSEVFDSVFPEDEISLVYAGGLHYRRFEPLIAIKAAIEKYNKESKKKATLYIYSNPDINSTIIDSLKGKYSKFCGLVDESELIKILNSCTIPVFVESFDSESIEATRLSLSTKIPEYLSLGKPILAVGPEEVSSITTLKSVAYCITDVDKINEEIFFFLNNYKAQSDLSEKAKNLYFSEFSKEIIMNRFRKAMNSNDYKDNLY